MTDCDICGGTGHLVEYADPLEIDATLRITHCHPCDGSGKVQKQEGHRRGAYGVTAALREKTPGLFRSM